MSCKIREGNRVKNVAEEKKQEVKKKKIDPKAVQRASSAVQEALLSTAEIQATMMQSLAIQDAMRGLIAMQEAIKRSTIGIQAMARYYHEINRRMVQVSLEIFYPYQAMKALMEARENTQRLAQQYVKIREMLQRPVPTLALIPELKAIPLRSERAIQSLYNYIAILEAELAKREKELAKKDERIRELIELLKEGKKELKGKYVA